MGLEALQEKTGEPASSLFQVKMRKRKKVKSLSRVRLFAAPWTAAYQAPPSMGFSRQEYWSGVPSPSPQSGEPGGNPGMGHSQCKDPEAASI